MKRVVSLVVLVAFMCSGFTQNLITKFTLEDLRFRFEGVKDYTFYNVLYNEINNGLIWLASKKFIYIFPKSIGCCFRIRRFNSR